jgi:hypothetical protein
VTFEGWSAVGRIEPGGAVGICADGHGPATFMDLLMAMHAEQDQVFGVGLAGLDPLNSMMGFGEGGWPITPRPSAATIAGDEEMP